MPCRDEDRDAHQPCENSISTERLRREGKCSSSFFSFSHPNRNESERASEREQERKRLRGEERALVPAVSVVAVLRLFVLKNNFLRRLQRSCRDTWSVHKDK